MENKKMKKGVIEIDKKKLERYIALNCKDVEFSAYHDELRCYWRMNKQCNEIGLSKNCPDDCPHLNGSVVRCKEGECTYVKKQIKELLPENSK